MKTKFLAASLLALTIASCKCNTTDETLVNGAGQGEGYDSFVAAPIVTSKGPMGDVTDRVLYSFDRYSLTAESKQTLDTQVQWLNNNPGTPVVIDGNCDERGTREYNLGLGARRANAAKEYLVSKGISAQRITVTSHGKDNPSVSGSNEEAWSKNRNAITIPQK